MLFPALRFVEMANNIVQLNDQEAIECILMVINEAVLSDDQIREQICMATPGLSLLDNVVNHNGIPYHNKQVYVPDLLEIKCQILCLYHNSLIAGHLGQMGMLELIRWVYWWKDMTKYVRDYVTGCHTCGRNKHSNWQPKGTMQPLPTLEGPWHWTKSDHIMGLPTSQGHDAIYVVMDRLTKMTHFIPTTT